MKKIIYIFCFVMGVSAYAQNNLGKADDAARITLAAVVSDEIDGLNPSEQKYLKNKLNQITAKNGMGGSAANERFIFTANVQIVTKDITPTAPPMHAYTLEVSFFVGDGIDGKLFASTSKTLKGVGETQTKAYKAALKNIRSTDAIFKTLMEDGKTKIIEYYNAQCDFILKEAASLSSQNEFESAIYKLSDVPEVCLDCYTKAMDAIVPIYQKQIDYQCTKLLTNARSAWSEGLDAGSAQTASTYLGQVDPNSKCMSDAQKLTAEISSRIKELDQREWDFELKQQQDDVDLQKATIKAARDVGVAYGENQPNTVVYSYSGWW